MAIDGHEVPVGQQYNNFDNSVNAGNSEFPSDYRSMNQHPATSFDNRGRQRYGVGHHELDRIAYEDLARTVAVTT